MRLKREEFGHEYTQYRFGYCETAWIEDGDSPADCYAKGFLPYSLDPSVHDRLYMARSARVRLSDFVLTSENRRIAKKFDGRFAMQEHTVEEARADKNIKELFVTYFLERHGPSVMPESRFEGILQTSLPLRILTYHDGDVLVAAVLEVTDGSLQHFWFSAYRLEYMNQSLGMWLLLDGVRRAKASGCSYCYIGTVYGERALYKTNLEPLEFWDGTAWNTDVRLLKVLARGE